MLVNVQNYSLKIATAQNFIESLGKLIFKLLPGLWPLCYSSRSQTRCVLSGSGDETNYNYSTNFGVVVYRCCTSMGTQCSQPYHIVEKINPLIYQDIMLFAYITSGRFFAER